MLAKVTFSQGTTGRWTTTDLSWVASLQDADPPHRWCSLGTGTVCASSEADAALAATTKAVNLYGADTPRGAPTATPVTPQQVTKTGLEPAPGENSLRT